MQYALKFKPWLCWHTGWRSPEVSQQEADKCSTYLFRREGMLVQNNSSDINLEDKPFRATKVTLCLSASQGRQEKPLQTAKLKCILCKNTSIPCSAGCIHSGYSKLGIEKGSKNHASPRQYSIHIHPYSLEDTKKHDLCAAAANHPQIQ